MIKNLMPIYRSTIRHSSLGGREHYSVTSRLNDQINFDLLYKYEADDDLIGWSHKVNTIFGYKTRRKQKTFKKPCPCCKTQYKQQDLSILSTSTTPNYQQLKDMKQGKLINKLGSEVLAIFTFIKIIIGYLFLRFIVLDILLLKTYYQKSLINSSVLEQYYLFASDIPVTNPYLQSFYMAFQYEQVIAFILVLYVILSIYFFIYFHGFQFDIYEAAESNADFENRYTILVENIPLYPIISGYHQKKFQYVSYEKRIQHYFQSIIQEKLLLKIKRHLQNPSLPTDKLKYFQLQLFKTLIKNKETNINKLQDRIVRAVNVCYDTSAIMRLEEEKTVLMGQFHKVARGKRCGQQRKKDDILKMLGRLNKQHMNILNNFHTNHSLKKRLPLFLGSALVTFDLQIYRDFMIAEYLHSPSTFEISCHSLTISDSQKPSSIQWNNFKHDSTVQLRTRIYTTLILMLVLVFTMVVLSYCQVYRIIPLLQQKLNLPKKYQQRIKALLISAVTASINFLLFRILQRLAEFQHRRNLSDTMVSLLAKNVVSQFINSALIYYFITFITSKDFSFQIKDLRQKVQYLVFISGSLKLLHNFFTLSYAFKKLIKWMYGRKCFQIQYNKMIERPEFDLVGKYSYYIVQLLTVSFYAPLSPVVVPALAFIFIVQYFIDKLILFNRSSIPVKVSFRMTDCTLFLAECSLLSFLVGWILFCPVNLWSPLMEAISYFCLFITILFLAYRFRMQFKNKQYFQNMFKSHLFHSQCKQTFLQTFDEYNPWNTNYQQSQVCQVDSQKSYTRSMNSNDFSQSSSKPYMTFTEQVICQ